MKRDKRWEKVFLSIDRRVYPPGIISGFKRMAVVRYWVTLSVELDDTPLSVRITLDEDEYKRYLNEALDDLVKTLDRKMDEMGIKR